MYNHPVREESLAKTILIVDDDPAIREFIVQYVQAETPYQIFAVADGFAALQLVQTIMPHLFLLDYHLGRMTGLQLIEQLRATKEHAQTPMVLMSARLPKEAREQPDVKTLEKPFALDDLAQLLASILT